MISFFGLLVNNLSYQNLIMFLQSGHFGVACKQDILTNDLLFYSQLYDTCFLGEFCKWQRLPSCHVFVSTNQTLN